MTTEDHAEGNEGPGDGEMGKGKFSAEEQGSKQSHAPNEPQGNGTSEAEEEYARQSGNACNFRRLRCWFANHKDLSIALSIIGIVFSAMYFSYSNPKFFHGPRPELRVEGRHNDSGYNLLVQDQTEGEYSSNEYYCVPIVKFEGKEEIVLLPRKCNKIIITAEEVQKAAEPSTISHKQGGDVRMALMTESDAQREECKINPETCIYTGVRFWKDPPSSLFVEFVMPDQDLLWLLEGETNNTSVIDFSGGEPPRIDAPATLRLKAKVQPERLHRHFEQFGCIWHLRKKGVTLGESATREDCRWEIEFPFERSDRGKEFEYVIGVGSDDQRMQHETPKSAEQTIKVQMPPRPKIVIEPPNPLALIPSKVELSAKVESKLPEDDLSSIGCTWRISDPRFPYKNQGEHSVHAGSECSMSWELTSTQDPSSVEVSVTVDPGIRQSEGPYADTAPTAFGIESGSVVIKAIDRSLSLLEGASSSEYIELQLHEGSDAASSRWVCHLESELATWDENRQRDAEGFGSCQFRLQRPGYPFHRERVTLTARSLDSDASPAVITQGLLVADRSELRVFQVLPRSGTNLVQEGDQIAIRVEDSHGNPLPSDLTCRVTVSVGAMKLEILEQESPCDLSFTVPSLVTVDDPGPLSIEISVEPSPKARAQADDLLVAAWRFKGDDIRLAVTNGHVHVYLLNASIRMQESIPEFGGLSYGNVFKEAVRQRLLDRDHDLYTQRATFALLGFGAERFETQGSEPCGAPWTAIEPRSVPQVEQFEALWPTADRLPTPRGNVRGALQYAATVAAEVAHTLSNRSNFGDFAAKIRVNLVLMTRPDERCEENGNTTSSEDLLEKGFRDAMEILDRFSAVIRKEVKSLQGTRSFLVFVSNDQLVERLQDDQNIQSLLPDLRDAPIIVPVLSEEDIGQILDLIAQLSSLDLQNRAGACQSLSTYLKTVNIGNSSERLFDDCGKG